jgi:hypothetical protein
LRRQVPEEGLRIFLLSGHDFFNELSPDILEDTELLQSYWRKWQEELLWEYRQKHVGCRPYGWWKYTMKMDPPPREAQAAWLASHHLLTSEERARLPADPQRSTHDRSLHTAR